MTALEVTLSVIVPAYNAVRHLRKCVESILAGVRAEDEILLIDDGSRDGTGNLCDSLAQEHSRIRVFHTENRGLPAARNLGLDNARGRFIGFVDADDAVAPAMYERLRRAMERGADLAMCRFLRCGETGGADFSAEGGACTRIGPEEAAWKMLSCCGPYVWNRLYRREILDTYRLRFRPEAQGAEDLFFNAACLTHCRTIAYVDAPLYAYTVTAESITHTFRTSRVVSDKYQSLPRASRYAAETLAELAPEVSGQYRARAVMYYQTVLRKLHSPSEAYLREACRYVSAHKGALLAHPWGWKYYGSALILCKSYRLWAAIFRRGICQ